MVRAGQVRQRVPLWGLLLILTAAPVPARAQGGGSQEGPLSPLRSAVTGPFSRPISTTSPEAQAFFDQGIQLFYAFSMGEALLSFREAQRLDPNCAMCFFGEAMASGPNLNASMRPGAAPTAHAAAQEALRISALPGSTTAVERALIEAMSTRFLPTHDPQGRSALDSAYARAMEGVYNRFSEDQEVGTLYAEALMLLDIERGSYTMENPMVREIHRLLEEVLTRDIHHPGACHMYIHATEATEWPDKAEECADFLADAVPGSSHMNHMPSHTYNRVGRWGDAVRSNIDAWHADQLSQWGEGVSYGAGHNLHMLLFSASFDGQAAVAIQAASDYKRMVSDGEFYHALVLLRFGRFDEILALSNPPANVNRTLWDFARGYAHLRTGAVDSASVYLAGIEETLAAMPPEMRWSRPGGGLSFRDAHSAPELMGIARNILRAELLREEGRRGEAIPLLEEAVHFHDRLAYDEPEPLPFSARHWLGAFLVEEERFAEAELVYLSALDQHPHNGWSLYGLERALRAQGKNAEADLALERFRKAWARSDTLLRSSRF